jgi:enoyl-CoA hydratase/carnithine racemase
MTPFFKIAQQGRVLIAALDNPPSAMPTDLLVDALSTLIDRADQDPSVGAVVMTDGRPSHAASASNPVSRGNSLMAALESLPGGHHLHQRHPADRPTDLPRFHRVLSRIGRSGSVFIAAIHGETAGSRLELAMACDMRFLSSQGCMAQPDMLWACPLGGGAAQRLPRLIGVARALELTLSGRAIEPPEALRIGLVSRVLAHDQLLAEAVASASILARRTKAVVATTKRAVLEGRTRALEDGLRLEQATLMAPLQIGTSG